MDAYNQYKKQRPHPLLDDHEIFHSIAALYKDGVFVIVDALDECQMGDNVRFKFIEALLRLQSKESNVNLLATSCPVP